MESRSERALLSVFREYLMEPGEMLCFHGQSLARHRDALNKLTSRNLLVKEKFKGGYSLTDAGYEAMTTNAKKA